MSKLPFRIAIPSRARAEVIHRCPLWQTATIVVDDENEKAEYVAAGVPVQNLVVCDPCANIGALRQWMLDNLWEKSDQCIVQMDDDFLGIQADDDVAVETHHRAGRHHRHSMGVVCQQHGHRGGNVRVHGRHESQLPQL